mmetsp:Transcript_127687/g.397657  ORF Transcript_127687/g.397657 Transcript_127687/m.397657 type:complete len:443 (-) Transcript_127687:1736-3064(-)
MDCRVEQACGHGQGDDVEAEGPEEVPHDRPEGGPAQLQEGHALAQLRADEGHVRGLHGDLGADADGDADVGLGQRRGVVDAVADETDPEGPAAPPLGLELLHALALRQRQGLRDDVPDADLLRNALRGRGIVAGAQPDLGSEVALQVVHDPLCVPPHGVPQSNGAQEPRVDVQDDDRVALLLQRRHPAKQLPRLLVLLHARRLRCLLVEAQIPDSGRCAIQLFDDTLHSPAAEVLEVPGRHYRRKALDPLHHAEDAFRHGMVARALQHAQKPPEAGLDVPGGRELRAADGLQDDAPGGQLQSRLWPLDVLGGVEHRLHGAHDASGRLNGGAPLGDGPRLVQNHGVDPCRGLQGGGTLHKAAAFGSHSCGHHHGHGSGQAHGARASDHEYCHAELHCEEKLQRTLHGLLVGARTHVHGHVLCMGRVGDLRHGHVARKHQDGPD